ncbi:hypothetical protein BN77_p2140059 [Rhizobium mesoamericanum STM3625]|uniref:DDE domain-containing protein n=1 Tax=Rhizobium mesoamericanum STM3625 TaxID=1211777 RepID=K0Q5C6_9HYPH|nr:hypothetical protein BN77_p2140059 [Rhizobium mesoamericanum STM3625]
MMLAVEHRSHKGLNNRAENSHLRLRKLERIMQGFRSVGGLQRFVSVFSALRNHSVPSHQSTLLSPPTFIASALWRNGKQPRPAQQPELN